MYAKAQQALMPQGLIAGWFDKGPTALWYACPNVLIQRMWNTLFYSEGRLCALLRTNSPNFASTEITRSLLHPLSTVFDLRIKGPQPHRVCNVLCKNGFRISGHCANGS